jgi:hypothetical protein
MHRERKMRKIEGARGRSMQCGEAQREREREKERERERERKRERERETLFIAILQVWGR